MASKLIALKQIRITDSKKITRIGAQQALFKCVITKQLHTNNPIIQWKKEYLSMFIICSEKATAFYNTVSHKSLQFNGVTVTQTFHLMFE